MGALGLFIPVGSLLLLVTKGSAFVRLGDPTERWIR